MRAITVSMKDSAVSEWVETADMQLLQPLTIIPAGENKTTTEK